MFKKTIRCHTCSHRARWTRCLCTVRQVVHTLPEGEPINGVTTLGDELFVFRLKQRDQVEVYDVITYRLQRFLNVPNAQGLVDVASCEHYRCVYMSDFMQKCVHRLDSEREVTQ